MDDRLEDSLKHGLGRDSSRANREWVSMIGRIAALIDHWFISRHPK